MTEKASGKTESKAVGKTESKTAGKIVAVRVRGMQGVSERVQRTLYQLGLRRKHAFAVLPDTTTARAMLAVARNHCTWGEASEETVKALEEKGKKSRKGLHPPRGGWKGSIKKHFPKGALGCRGEKINDLIKKML